jgi:ketosteroid isomerase-like protein
VEERLSSFEDRTWHTDAEVRDDPAWPGSTVTQGREEVAARQRELVEALGIVSVELHDAIEADGKVVALFTARGKGAASEVPVERRWAWVIEVRDARFYRVRAYADSAEAPRGVGVPRHGRFPRAEAFAERLRELVEGGRSDSSSALSRDAATTSCRYWT